ncbi:hypothetical protein ON010_g4496 [Phytophthora cinnamomi]|nr:hypothetical protein ON010_g4496 [Phytophthora cinnamomi]
MASLVPLAASQRWVSESMCHGRRLVLSQLTCNADASRAVHAVEALPRNAMNTGTPRAPCSSGRKWWTPLMRHVPIPTVVSAQAAQASLLDPPPSAQAQAQAQVQFPHHAAQAVREPHQPAQPRRRVGAAPQEAGARVRGHGLRQPHVHVARVPGAQPERPHPGAAGRGLLALRGRRHHGVPGRDARLDGPVPDGRAGARQGEPVPALAPHERAAHHAQGAGAAHAHQAERGVARGGRAGQGLAGAAGQAHGADGEVPGQGLRGRDGPPDGGRHRRLLRIRAGGAHGHLRLLQVPAGLGLAAAHEGGAAPRRGARAAGPVPLQPRPQDQGQPVGRQTTRHTRAGSWNSEESGRRGCEDDGEAVRELDQPAEPRGGVGHAREEAGARAGVDGVREPHVHVCRVPGAQPERADPRAARWRLRAVRRQRHHGVPGREVRLDGPVPEGRAGSRQGERVSALAPHERAADHHEGAGPVEADQDGQAAPRRRCAGEGGPRSHQQAAQPGGEVLGQGLRGRDGPPHGRGLRGLLRVRADRAHGRLRLLQVPQVLRLDAAHEEGAAPRRGARAAGPTSVELGPEDQCQGQCRCRSLGRNGGSKASTKTHTQQSSDGRLRNTLGLSDAFDY